MPACSILFPTLAAYCLVVILCVPGVATAAENDESVPPAPVGFQLRMSDFLPDDSPSVSKRVYRLKFTPDGQSIAIRDGGNSVWQYDLREKTALQAEIPEGDRKRIMDLAYSLDGSRLYGISESGSASLLCWNSADLQLVWQSDSVAGKDILMTPTGELLINGRELMDIDLESQVPRVRKRAGLVRSWEGSVSLLLQNLAAGSDSRLEWRDRFDESATKVVASPPLPLAWQAVLQREVGRAVGRQGSVSGALILAADGNRVVVKSRRGLLLWDAATEEPWQELGSLQKPLDAGYIPLSGDILTVAMSPNGQWMAVGTVGTSEPNRVPGEVHLIDAVCGRWIGRLTTTYQSASALDFSDDSRWLAVGSSSLVEDHVRIFDLEAWFAEIVASRQWDVNEATEADFLAAEPFRPLVAMLSSQASPGRWQAILQGRLEYDFSSTRHSLLAAAQALDSQNYAGREEAEGEMRLLAVQFPAVLREILDDRNLSSETRFRLQRVVGQVSGVVRLPTSKWRSISRTMYALERIEQPWAGELLRQAMEHPVRAIARQATISHHGWLARQRNRLSDPPANPSEPRE